MDYFSMRSNIAWGCLFLLCACNYAGDKNIPTTADTIKAEVVDTTTIGHDTKLRPYDPATTVIHTGNATPGELVAFAQTLQGVPYKYGSVDPADGFDCSGFITYVFNHFNISVPRSSVDFTNIERTIPLAEAMAGDLVLFTGTDSTIRVVGHMGIIVSNENGNIEFIHSTSGKAYGVTVTPLNSYYMGRFVKILRIFLQNG
jgi:cell wall-associated NlpC family hydrolase